MATNMDQLQQNCQRVLDEINKADVQIKNGLDEITALRTTNAHGATIDLFEHLLTFFGPQYLAEMERSKGIQTGVTTIH